MSRRALTRNYRRRRFASGIARTQFRPASSAGRERGTVAAWLLSAVRHRAIDPAPGTDLAAVVIAREDAERLAASLARLPDAQQEVIVLAYYGRLTHREIAHQLGLPAGTVQGGCGPAWESSTAVSIVNT